MPLSVDEKLSATEFAASLAATRIFGLTTLVTAQENDLEFQIFSERTQRTIPWSELSKQLTKQAKRHIRDQIDKEIMRRECLEELPRLSRHRGTLVTGTLCEQYDNGTWTVLISLDDGVADIEQRYAEYPLKFQPDKEKSGYLKGQQHVFLITSVLPVSFYGGWTKNLILLSKRAKNLPILLARSIDYEATTKAKLRVIKRIPGYMTELQAQKALPRKLVAALAQMLNEKIIFRK